VITGVDGITMMFCVPLLCVGPEGVVYALLMIVGICYIVPIVHFNVEHVLHYLNPPDSAIPSTWAMPFMICCSTLPLFI